MPRLTTIGFILIAVVSAACSPILQVEPAAPYYPGATAIGVEQTDRSWWQLRFKLVWPEGEAPDFSRDLLIAEQLLLPAIMENQAEMPLWRFHRRAVRTPAGHQFSMVFYANEVTATRIRDGIESDPLAVWLTDSGLIEKIRFDRRDAADLDRLELGSDPAWPIEVQRSWPYFIMGASQAWLLLVHELSSENALAGKVDYPDLLEHYRGVNARLNDQWRENGQHVYLHHLNAVFGYQPLKVDTTSLTSF